MLLRSGTNRSQLSARPVVRPSTAGNNRRPRTAGYQHEHCSAGAPFGATSRLAPLEVAVRRGPLPRKPTANTHRTDPDRSTSRVHGGSACGGAPSGASGTPASRFPFPVAAPVAALLRAAGGRLRPALGGLLLLRVSRKLRRLQRRAPSTGQKGPQERFSRGDYGSVRCCALPQPGEHSRARCLQPDFLSQAGPTDDHAPTVCRAPCQYKDKWPSAGRTLCTRAESQRLSKRGLGS